jgi:UDPglucose 6-dehydrogenase
MKITIIGSGYVGLVAAVCFADAGNDVICLDINKLRIKNLTKGIIPIYEPGLEELAIKNIKNKKLVFTTDIKKSVKHGDVQFICVGTPQSEDGSADINYVLSAAANIAKNMTKDKIIVNKSTVPVGSAKKVSDVIKDVLQKRNLKINYSVVSNPEFLREGTALKDFLYPDRVVIGSSDPKSTKVMKYLYKDFVKSSKSFIAMDPISAELTKYAANALLACRISFMNEMANLSEVIGANIEEVKRGIGSDNRIGNSFLNAGCGYGGSCFPKDVAALQKLANDQAGIDLKIIKAATQVNKDQKDILYRKISKRFGGKIKDKNIAIWGLSFKPDTDDMREAPSIELINKLILKGANVKAYDPVAIIEARKVFKNMPVKYKKTKEECLKNADALVIVTEWEVFKDIDKSNILSLMKSPIIFDGRNIINQKNIIGSSIEYYPIGKPAIA